MITLQHLANAGKDDLEDLAVRFERIEELHNHTTQLMWEVSQIPYLCGKVDCDSPGCVAVRNAHAHVRELLKLAANAEP